MARQISGPRIRLARIRANISREQLAVSINRTAQTVFVYETGRVIPPGNVLAKIVDTLGCSFEDLLVEEVTTRVA
jgi:DNA-binding XRE family transcriptional regulator